MRYRDGVAFRQALEQRLKDAAAGDGARLARDRKRVAFDRLLARLAAAAPDRWLLKGGFALDLRLAERARATKDIDIDWQAGEDELLDALIDAANSDAGDFFSFAIERAGTPDDRLAGSRRFRITATLAGRSFDTFLLDASFRRQPVPQIEMLTTPDFLAFADIEPVTVRAIPLELQIAEKLHAYTRTYEGARPSTRAKDLVDLALIAELSTLDADALQRAIDATFTERASHDPPASLASPPPDWRAPFGQLAESVGVAPVLESGHAVAAALLDPILQGRVERGSWNPGEGRWVTNSP